MRAPLPLLLAAMALAAAPAAHAGRSVATAERHAHEDAVAHSRAKERAMARNTSAATAIDAADAKAASVGGPEDVGSWGPVVGWPVVGVHVALLADGKVLAYDSVGDNATETYPVHDFTRATVWDPATGTHTHIDVDTGYNIFCSGLAHIPSGALLLAGGNKDDQLNGIVQTHIFRHPYEWVRGADMRVERWYPSVTPMASGEMLITGGRPGLHEVRQRGGALRALSAAEKPLPLYPWFDVAPDGRAFYSGPSAGMLRLDTAGTGSWSSEVQRDSINRDYGSRAMYDVGKILVAGGGPSTATSRVVDINGATPTSTATGSMHSGRRQHNLTVLADGSVLATGGNSSGAGLVDLDNGVYPAERWDPATGQWTELAPMQVTRQYHSTALLLPDGRVLSSGGGICGTCDEVGYRAKNAEIFTPPYLYAPDGSPAPRPTITGARRELFYGAPLQISTPDAASIAKVGLVRISSVTHSVNMEQRYIPLSFTAGTDSLTATVPASANIAPPGVYMLFIVDDDGVPSVGRMMRIALNQKPTASITSPFDWQVFDPGQTIPVTVVADDPDGKVTKVEFLAGTGTIKLGEDTTEPFTFDWTGAAEGVHTLRARATDEDGAAVTSARVRLRVRYSS